jgi:hypothetical protein
MDLADAELIWPGNFIDHPDSDAAHSALLLLYALDSAFTEGVLALVYFGEAVNKSASQLGPDRWESDMAERREAEEAAWQGRADPVFTSDWAAMRAAMDEKRIEGERELTRRRWALGELPRSVAHHLPFLYARAFLFALDSIEKLLNVLSESPVPTAAADAAGHLVAAVPGVRQVRDTAHHQEDRIRGLDRRGKPLDLKPIDSGGIHAPGGALVLNNLNGTRYGCTVEDGRFVEVEVTPASLIAARDAIQEVLDSVSWRHNERRRSPMP